MNDTLVQIRRHLIVLLGQSHAKQAFAHLRWTTPMFNRWASARLVSSFLARRTSCPDSKKEVLRALLLQVLGRGRSAQLAGAILLLAGALIVKRLRCGTGSPPTATYVLILTAPSAIARPDDTPPLQVPRLATLQLPTLSTQGSEVAQ